MRKLTAARDGSDQVVRTVATHMTHGHETAKKYYQHLEGVQQRISSRKRAAPLEPQEITPRLKKRKMWLKEEELLKTHMDMDKTPNLEDCTGMTNCSYVRTSVEQSRDKETLELIIHL